MASYDLVRIPNLVSLDFHNLVKQSLGDSYSLFIELRAVLVVNYEHVLVNAHKYFLHVELVDQLFDYFGNL